MITSTNSWLPLAEYSIKHQVSISTLRRRIKTEDIKFRFDDGKYLIFDEVLDEALKKTEDKLKNKLDNKLVSVEEHRPSPNSEVQKNSAPSALAGFQQSALVGAQQVDIKSFANESVISAANRLLADLKKAYTQILLEKEEQILQLREETMDLKTLIKVLESENTRLREPR